MTDNDQKAVTGGQARPGTGPSPATSSLPSPDPSDGCPENRTGEKRAGEQQADNALLPQAMTEEEADLGHALRNIYRQTVEEAIPDEMLDLLKRLD